MLDQWLHITYYFLPRCVLRLSEMTYVKFLVLWGFKMVATFIINIIVASSASLCYQDLRQLWQRSERRDKWWNRVGNFIRGNLGHQKLPENTGENTRSLQENLSQNFTFFDLETALGLSNSNYSYAITSSYRYTNTDGKLSFYRYVFNNWSPKIRCMRDIPDFH